MPWYLGNSYAFGHARWPGLFWLPAFIIPLALWSVIWTGLALWHAARREQKGWFIFFLFVHTAGIIEMLYLLFVAKAFSSPSRSTTKRKRS